MKTVPTLNRILLIEDNPFDAEFLAHTLRKLSLNKPVTVLRDAESALEFLQRKLADQTLTPDSPPPSLIFLDLNLPGRSGLEVLAWLRQQPMFRKVCVIVLTGSRHTIDIYRAYELGADSYLVKPVYPTALREVLKSVSLQRPLRFPADLPSATSHLHPPSPSSALLSEDAGRKRA